jgi:hypothetical protein
MTPRGCDRNDGRAEWEWSASGAEHTGFAMAAGCERWSGGRRRGWRRGFWCCGDRRRLGGDERTRRAKQKKRRWARMGWASQATPFVYREKVQFTTLDVPAKSEFPPWTPEVRSAALVDSQYVTSSSPIHLVLSQLGPHVTLNGLLSLLCGFSPASSGKLRFGQTHLER